MATIRPTAATPPQKSLPTLASALSPAPMGSTYTPPDPVPIPPQGKRLKQIQIGGISLFQKGLVSDALSHKGFLAKPTPIRGFTLPIGTWVEIGRASPPRATLTQGSTIADIQFPYGARFYFFDDGTHVFTMGVIQWKHYYLSSMEFSKEGRLESMTLEVPMELPIGEVPSGSRIVYDSQGIIDSIELSRDTLLQGIELTNRLIDPGSVRHRVINLPDEFHVVAITYDTFTTPVFLHPNGSVRAGTLAENTSFGERALPQGALVLFDADGDLLR